MKKYILSLITFMLVFLVHQKLESQFCQVTGPPGCPESPECEAVICASDAFCCEEAWDGICASAAQSNPICLGMTGSSIPTLGQWGLILLILLLTTVGLVALRNKKFVLG